MCHMFVICNTCHTCVDMLCTLGKEDSLSGGSKVSESETFKESQDVYYATDRAREAGEGRPEGLQVWSTPQLQGLSSPRREAVTQVRLERGKWSQDVLRRQSKRDLMTAHGKREGTREGLFLDPPAG